jgi:hypothetical protein
LSARITVGYVYQVNQFEWPENAVSATIPKANQAVNDEQIKSSRKRRLRPDRYLTAALALASADVTTITALEEDWWRCACGNTPHSDGFVPVDRRGREVEPTARQWPEPLYLCTRCGLVMDAATVDMPARTVAVVGRVVL